MTTICAVAELTPDRGVAALVGDTPVAVFLLSDGSVHAISDVDPVTGVSVLSRGLVGEATGRPTVASPLHKQRYDLRTGACLDDPDLGVPVHHAEVRGGVIHVRLAT